MRVTLDSSYLDRVIKAPEDTEKILTAPSIESIICRCNKPEYGAPSYLSNLPMAWLTDEIFDGLVNAFQGSAIFKILSRFISMGKLPKLTDEQKLNILKRESDCIVFFPELPYKVWMEYFDGIYSSDQIPVAYRTQELLLAVMENGGEIKPELMTDVLVDAYIEANKTLSNVPVEMITLERVKKVLRLHPDSENLEEKKMERIVVDKELADLLCKKTWNFRYIPAAYRTRDRLVTLVASTIKSHRIDFWNTGIPEYLRNKKWLDMKFNLEVIEKAGDDGVKAIQAIYKEFERKDPPLRLDMVALVKAYPGAIKYVNRSDQTKAMADAVLGSVRASELKGYLSLKFITKKSVPLFLSSENVDVIDKVERVLTGAPKKPVVPPYSIPDGHAVELELTEDDISNLKRSGIPFIM